MACSKCMTIKRVDCSNKINIHTQVKDYNGVFHADNGLLFCNYYDFSIKWKHKSTIDVYCASKRHDLQRKIFKTKEKAKSQQTLQTTLLSIKSKNEVIEDLIEAFAFFRANIPLEKVNILLSFFKKHLNKGVQAQTLHQLYLPRIFNKHVNTFKSIFDSKPVCIIMNESSNNCE
ncbi:hypothetical protein RhiirA1_543466 [Rhizophagus irregularis]|uniref:Uncharacterized protein n=1 Tax=Rhizophagus irregularis TaxID=588596 RepID=A0A2N0QNE1_9GLOM|nr:hypothetical protein RhiirA1_543466 [Rhizophagus irregularis]